MDTSQRQTKHKGIHLIFMNLSRSIDILSRRMPGTAVAALSLPKYWKVRVKHCTVLRERKCCHSCARHFSGENVNGTRQVHEDEVNALIHCCLCELSTCCHLGVTQHSISVRLGWVADHRDQLAVCAGCSATQPQSPTSAHACMWAACVPKVMYTERPGLLGWAYSQIL